MRSLQIFMDDDDKETVVSSIMKKKMIPGVLRR